MPKSNPNWPTLHKRKLPSQHFPTIPPLSLQLLLRSSQMTSVQKLGIFLLRIFHLCHNTQSVGSNHPGWLFRWFCLVFNLPCCCYYSTREYFIGPDRTAPREGTYKDNDYLKSMQDNTDNNQHCPRSLQMLAAKHFK